MQTPQDRLFKRVFSNPEEVAGELRHVLPQAVTRLIDWSTLRANEQPTGPGKSG